MPSHLKSGLKVLIIPDKLKGSLTAIDAAKAIAQGWNRSRPQDSLELMPMSDGGDGFCDAMNPLITAKPRTARAVDAAHRPCAVKWALAPGTRTAIIESANVIGLAMLPSGRFHPFNLDTFGLGVLIREVVAAGAQHCLIGLGGSATNDGGFGLARALGWEFHDAAGRPITRWTSLGDLATIRPAPKRGRLFARAVAAVDVRNPLLGWHGATCVYGPQKGLHGADLIHGERCLRRLAQVVARALRHDFAREPGAGAAGGLGFGVRAFLNARLEPGFQIFAQESKLEQHLSAADLVITAEGTIDNSSLMGKGVGQIAKRCHELGTPCIGLAGLVNLASRKRRVFTQLRSLTELTVLTGAKRYAAQWLARLATLAAGAWSTKT
jgi:glycerate kinase